MFRFSGALLRQRREAAGWTRERLAHRIRSHQSTIVKLERGEIRPSSHTLGALAEVLHCSIDDFYARSDKPDHRVTDTGVLVTAPAMTETRARRTSIALFGPEGQ